MLERLKQLSEIVVALSALLRVLIPAVEVPGWGDEKKKLVKDVAEYFINLIEEHFFKLPISKEIILKGIDFLIEAYVAFFNRVGEFISSHNAMHTDSGGNQK